MSFLDGPWNIDTLQVLGVVALLLLLDGTLGVDISDRGTVLLDLKIVCLLFLCYSFIIFVSVFVLLLFCP